MPRNLLQSAIRNNAEWCELVARSHGVPNGWLDNAWRATGSMPAFYLNVVSLEASMGRGNTSSLAEGLPQNCGWKDSFADLDLVEFGFKMRFEAIWYALTKVDFSAAGAKLVGVVTSAEQLEEWVSAWGETPVEQPVLLPELMGPNVQFIFHQSAGRIDSGLIANMSADAVGITNSFGCPGGIAHCIRYAFERAQGVPVVGYGSDDDLRMLVSLGFKALGSLRVWVR
ncbi:MAG: hypothetical protein ACI9SB_001578 [Candidatus Azotimanducaceae bacterium]|jgi:hypothetical protein